MTAEEWQSFSEGTTAPAWCRCLERLCAELAKERSAPATGTISQNLASPVIRHAMGELSAQVPPERLARLSATARESLRDSLEKRLCQSGGQAFAWFQHAFEMTPGLPLSRDAGEMKALFFFQGVETETRRFLEIFPALARLWAIQVEAWLDFIGDFLAHALLFAERSAFPETWQIRGLTTDLSDAHRGGRTVLRVQFGNGQIWFYKPRSGEGDKAWFDLLLWVNGMGISRPFRLLEIDVAVDHCWVEAVEPEPCRHREEVASYYHRAGALLYLSYVLGGIDLHCDNLIAAGEHPVLIDCETLFHESVSEPGFSKKMERSLLRCGLLPTLDAAGKQSVSGLGADAHGSHTVWWDARAISARDFAEEIVAGFEEAHRILSREPQRAIFKKRSAAMSRLTWRKITRPTARYLHFLERSLAPGALLKRDGRRAILTELNNDLAVDENRAVGEVRQLADGDIPFFHGPGELQDFRLDDSVSIIRSSLTARR